MTNRDEANKLATKITGETVNAPTTKGALEAISGKKAGSIAQAIDDIVQGNIPSGDVTVEELTVTENGTYTADEGKAYSPVTVNVPASAPNLQNKTVTENGVVTADAGYDGLGEVTVSVPSSSPTTMYCWQDDLDPPEEKAFCVIPNPKVGDKVFWIDADGVYSITAITAVTETTLTTSKGTLTRTPSEDVVLVS